MKKNYVNSPSYFWKRKFFHTEEDRDAFMEWRKNSYEFQEVQTYRKGFEIKYRKTKNKK